jgi:hypothetical protein
VTAPEQMGLVERLAREAKLPQFMRDTDGALEALARFGALYAAAEIERLSAALADAEQLICALRGERQTREQALSRISALAQGNTQ